MTTAQIICGDARQIMKRMTPGSVDLVVTDPPYRVIGGGNQGRSDQPGGILNVDENDGRSFTGKILNGQVCEPREYLFDLYRVLRDPGHLYLFTNFLNLEENLRQLRLAGFELHGLLTWKKQNATPNRWYMKNGEYVILARRGAAFTINDPGSMMIVEFKSVTERQHPAQKPVDLLKYYIANSSQPGDTVFDPFCGSGSTGEAAIDLGRRFIGLEMNLQYASLSASRLNTAVGVLP